MDTKLKSNKQMTKWKTLILILVLLAIPANWLYSSYWQTRSQAANEQVNIFETDDFYWTLNEITRSLYAELIEKKVVHDEELLSELVQIQDVITEDNYWNFFGNEMGEISVSELTETQLEELTLEYAQMQMRSNLESFRSNRIRRFRNLQFAAFHHDSGDVLSNGNNELQAIATGETRSDSIATWNYQYLVVFSYDDRGNLSVDFTINGQSMVTQMLMQNAVTHLDSEILNWSPIRNTTFVFGIPWSLGFDDEISNFQNANQESVFLELMRGNILVATVIVTVIGILIPLKTMKKHDWFKKMLEWPPEIIVTLLVIVMTIMFGVMPHVANAINDRNAGPSVQGWFGPFHNSFYIRLYWRLINIGIWTALFSALSLTILYMKNYIPSKKVRSKTKLDLKNPQTVKLALFTGIHFLLISALCFMGWFGIIIASAYSICGFVLIRKYFIMIQGQYSRILEMANEMLAKNLETTIAVDEDLGLFNSMKDKLLELQLELKDIVEDDSKNQKFREELINYLSDELKDPITAILMYVELLKDENLDDSLKQNYLKKVEQLSNQLNIRIEDLFEISKVGTGHYELDLKPVDLVNQLQEAITEVEEQIEDPAVMLRTQFPENLPAVRLDVESMHQVFVNLLLNMVKYGLPRTRAYVNVTERAEVVEVMYRNISMTEIDLNVDELMAQRETSKSGLKMMKNYVELNGGTFEIGIDGDLFKVVLTLNKAKREVEEDVE